VISIPYLGLVLIVALSIIKLLLILRWTQSLFRAHGDNYSFKNLLLMMFCPQSETTVGPRLWKDLRPIQRMNWLTNLGFTLLIFVVVLGVLAIGK
jgi:hypothetical protein